MRGTRPAKAGFVAALAAAYTPRRPTETVLYGLVRQYLESFLAHARENYDGGLPRYVEQELRAFLKCGVFAEGFTRARVRCVWTRSAHRLLLPRSQHLSELLWKAHGQRGRSLG
jgi:hypothetical protein